jgi:uncharacterized membrane protein
MTAAAVALALGTVRLDQALLLDRRAGATWLFGGGAEGARGVLSAIAGTMITVTGVVFSITIVALQLASGQFSPRVLRTFTGDRGNQVVLGAFIGAFTYALLVLRSVRSASEDGARFVPSASVTVAIVLALCSIGLLIYYIHHAASSIRASVVIDRAARDTFGLIDDLFPADVGRPAPSPAFDPAAAPAAGVRAAAGGYLQTIDEDALFDLAEAGSLTVRPAPRVGEFVLSGAMLADVWPAAAFDADPDLADAIRGACVLGSERTLQADVELGFRQLADIAIKALSPGINDPTTATICVDRLAEALVRLADRGRPREVRTGTDGAVRVVLHGPPFDRLVGVAFDQIRHYGAGDATVAAHLATTLGRVAALAPPARRAPLRAQADLVLAGAREQIAIPADLERVERAGAWTQTGAGGWP